MSHPKEIIHSLEKFRKDHPNQERCAFLMMSFNQREIYQKITEELKKILKDNSITLLRVDDKEYHSDLFLNLQTYLHGCGFGIAILDRIKSNDVNPNVSFEIGYMMSMFKDVLLIVDESIEILQADLTGKLYKKFDSYNLESLREPTVKWLKDHHLCFGCYECAVELDEDTASLFANRSYLDSLIEELVILGPNKTPYVKGIMSSVENHKNTVLVFEGDVEFYNQIKRMHTAGRLLNAHRTKVVSVTTLNEYDNHGSSGMALFDNNYCYAICRRESWENTHDIINKAKLIIGSSYVFKIEESSICIIYQNDSLYFIPNYISPGELYPSKLHLVLWKMEQKDVYVLDIIKLIFAHETLKFTPSEKEIIVANHKNIKYFIQEDVYEMKDKFTIHFDGARSISKFK